MCGIVITAIMNQQKKREYYKRFSRFQQSREKKFAPKIFKAIRSQYQFVIDNVQKGYTAIDLINHFDLKPIIESIYLDAATVYGAKIRADLNRQKARMPIGFNEQMYQLIRQYFASDILNTSAGITETTKELIRKVFAEAYAQGLGFDDIVEKLKDTELSQVRSRMIARTETVTAANQGAVFAAQQTGLKLKKEWLATIDNRTRHDHLFENGKTVAMDEYFSVGGYDMFQPGDRGGKNGKPKVAPKEIINCRCTVLFEPVRENGSLVRV